ncbi:HAD-IIB family hydrolase [Marinobacter sp.]|uniref:HAD-IIB family hydrolase n=1 Tax=Marinobacter sp. TaxID=50741 RepID=UPI00384B04DE
MSRPRLIIFTDLDGTLLDHDTYDWSPAKPALEELEKHRIPLILNSSKTTAELQRLRREIGNHHPYIAENGAVLVIPAGYFGSADADADAGDSDSDEIIRFGSPRQDLLEVLGRLREDGYSFLGFNDMSVEQLAAETGLDPASAALAKKRLATEPVLWQGNQMEIDGFRRALEQEDLKLVKGGRFFHVMGAFDKARPIGALMKRYQSFYAGEELVSVALGDGPNDRPMLEEADIAVVIRAARPEPLVLSEDHSVMYSDRKGPEGWKQCVMTILAGKGY